MTRSALRFTLFLGLLACLVLAAACGGGSDGEGDASADAVAPQPADGGEAIQDQEESSDFAPGGSEEGTATVIADGNETKLGVDQCIPPEGDSPIVVIATNAAEGASLSLGGIAGAVTAEFNREGETWIAVGAILDVEGSTFRYDGPALKEGAVPPDSSLAFEVTC